MVLCYGEMFLTRMYQDIQAKLQMTIIQVEAQMTALCFEES